MADLPNGDVPGVDDVTQAQPSATSAVAFIGSYRLLQRVGEGGMGEVWLAEQTHPVRRQVALKIIKAGMDTAQVVARFEAERQALAVMDHPAIARVFDGGATPQGRPYFVMEYVRGETIASYCNKHKLPIRDRIDLFLHVCDGVQHAHQKGIIHRDLKPSNILVTVQDDHPVPKIIDFGVAKAMTQRLADRTLYTEIGALIGTPEYMSPEQAEMSGPDIDTRTDVYALGVVLYELLTGMLPFDSKALREKPLDEIRRTIREIDPPRPSTRVTTIAKVTPTSAESRPVFAQLARQLRGDLDWITMRALEKDRTRRYGSASDLAADLRRHLDNLPVLASPPSTLYRLGKFAKRHRIGVLSATAMVILLIALAVTMTVQAGRISRERDRANREAQAAKQISDFIVGLFSVSDPSQARGNSVTAREILDEGAKNVGTLTAQPTVKARLEKTLGSVYTSLGLYALAEPLLQHAVEVDRASLGQDDADTLAAEYAVGELRYYQNRYREAESAYRDVAERRKRLLGEDARDTIEAEMAVATVCYEQGRFDEAERLFRSLIERERRVLGEEDGVTLNTLSNFSSLYYRQERYDEALKLAMESAEVSSRIFGDDSPRALVSWHNVATTLDKLRRYEEAERTYLKTINGRRKVLGLSHPRTARSEWRLAEMWVGLRRYADAEPLIATAYNTFDRSFGPANPSTQSVVKTAVALYEGWDKPARAAEWRAKLSTELPTKNGASR